VYDFLGENALNSSFRPHHGKRFAEMALMSSIIDGSYNNVN
jgi:hypothetical protein